MLDVGTVIAGKLRIERIIGRGGMGVVAEATHLQLDQRVAVKVMREQVAGDPATVERFLREARAAAKLTSEHVCRVTDVGQLDSGAPYIVMELLAGTDLAQLVSSSPLPIATAVDYVLQACIAIGEAHVRGIVHRDLKPANLFLTKQLGGAPLVKVLDFGIAKAPSTDGAGLTQTESVMGSPGYMSPEQLRSSKDVDARTDIWALGVILYQLVSGRLPFSATSVTEFAVKVAMDPPDPLDGDAAFVSVVMRCLEKSPTARFADVRAFATALASFGTESAKRSLAVIEKLEPAPAADSLASTMPAVDVNAPTAASSLGSAATVASQPSGSSALGSAATAALQAPSSTTLGSAATAVATAPPTASKRGLVLGGLGLAAAGSLITLLVLRGKEDASPSPAPSTLAAAPASDAPQAAPSPAPDLAPPPVPSAAPAQDPQPAPGARPRPSPTSSSPTPAAPKPKDSPATLLAAFDKAVTAERCREASRLWERLKYSGADADAIEKTGKRLNDCLLAQGDAIVKPTAPGAVRRVIMMGEEMLEEQPPLAKAARELIEVVLRTVPDDVAARTFAVRAACIEKNGDAARAHAAKLPAKHPGVPVCAQRGIDLEAKQAGEPTPDVPADWKAKLDDMVATYDVRNVRDLALDVLAKSPNDKDAAYYATIAYCYLGDATNARKYGAKLDDTLRAKAKRSWCDSVDLSSK